MQESGVCLTSPNIGVTITATILKEKLETSTTQVLASTGKQIYDTSHVGL
jgi:hypothetical protein